VNNVRHQNLRVLPTDELVAMHLGRTATITLSELSVSCVWLIDSAVESSVVPQGDHRTSGTTPLEQRSWALHRRPPGRQPRPI